jgi:DNA-binding response OmpR family regulator
MHVLLVTENTDDNKIVSFLQAHGYETGILEHVSGVPLLASCDLLIYDWVRPVLEFQDQWRTMEGASEIPVIILSEAGDIATFAPFFKKRLWYFIKKPIHHLENLLVGIDQLVQQRQLIDANQQYCEVIKNQHDILKHDHMLGRDLQKHLLPPRKAELLGIHLDYCLHPSLYISGDFTDYLQLGDRYVIFYLADVSGHGVSSAFVGVLLKALVQQHCAEYLHMNNGAVLEPEKMLAILNKGIMHEKLQKYVTLIYMIYDNLTEEIRYAVAGHHPFPIYKALGKPARYLEVPGYPVGLVSQAVYHTHVLKTDPQWQLFLLSDGIWEMMPDLTLPEKEVLLLKLAEESLMDIEDFERHFGIAAGKVLKDDVSSLFVRKEA